jgi:hypothetical protein
MRPVESVRLRARRWKQRPAGNVIPLLADDGFHMSRAAGEISPPCPGPPDELTAALVIDQYRRGVLPEALIIYLLAGAGVQA